MNSKATWSRRAFLQGVGYTSVSGMLTKRIPVSRTEVSSPEIAYVASAGSGDDFSGSGIHVFEVHGDDWTCKQQIPSRSPVSLAVHPHQHVLYVANQIDEYQGLPCGTVEAYRIDLGNGTLTFLNRQPLSLSAVFPKHIAVSPDGTHLVAAIHGGGAYNVLAIHADGSLGGVGQILKEVGAGTHPVCQTSAHPHTAMFDKTGQYLFATDEGSDRFNVFAYRNGGLARIARIPCRPASGPGHLVIHPSSRFVYVSNALDGTVVGYLWDAHNAEIREIQRVSINSISASYKESHLAMSPSGRVLYAASAEESISAWDVDPVAGGLSFRQKLSLNNCSVVSLAWSTDRKRIFAVDSSRGEIRSISVRADTGELGREFVVAKMIAPASLLISA